MQRFTAQLKTHLQLDFANYEELHQWSIDRPELFWAQVWDFTGIQSSRRWDTVLADADQFPGAQWFSGAALNFAETSLY